ncbi:MAG: flagellar export protein FliJ [Thermodesulfovibrionales bacterium]|nr:flagellar export protein FliJ [Thermodesulfovibrionales bacterium]
MTEKRIRRIINLKENAKEEMDREIKRINRELTQGKENLNSIENAMDRLLAGFQPHASSMNPLELELFYNSLFELQKEASKEKRQIKALEDDLETKKAKALELSREKKLLDILLKRLVRERLTKASKDEQREMDFDFIIRRLRE